MPLVSRTGFGVIDRQANFILGALDASSFLFPIGQQRQPGELEDCVGTYSNLKHYIQSNHCFINVPY